MKSKVIALVLGLMLFLGKVYGSSELTITNIEGSPFYVIFNSEVIDPGSAVLQLFDVAPGTHTIDVYRYIRDVRGGYTKYVEMIYRGSLFVDARTHIVTHLTHDGRLMIISRVPVGGPSGGQGKGGGRNGHGNSGYYGGQNSHHGEHVMTIPEFNSLKNSVRDASFEQTKLLIAKEALRHNLVTSDMVYHLMTMFSFEATRLEFAKYAYSRTSDKHNFHRVNKAFSFDASRRDLTLFISKQG